MAAKRVTILFDIDGTLINSGGAGAASWRLAFDELYGIPADIGEFTDAGMTDPDVGRRTFEAVMHRAPERAEFARLLERRLHYMHETIAGLDHLPSPAGRRGDAAAAAQRRLPAGDRDRKRRGRRAHQAGTGPGSTGSSRSEDTAPTRVIGARSHASRSSGRPLSTVTTSIRRRPSSWATRRAMWRVPTPPASSASAVASGHYTVEQLREANADYAISSLKEPLPV